MNSTFNACRLLFILFSANFIVTLARAQNPIVTENALPGNPRSEWDISGAGDLSTQGFSTDISVNRGNTVYFKINTDAAAYTIDIYRLGYYDGDGARHVGYGVITASLPQAQPAPLSDPLTGLVDCGNWSESAHWDVPATAVSGVYIAKLTRTDNNDASHITFIVRDDGGSSDLLFKTSDATWQAYNIYGGNSAYIGATTYPNGHAVKLSYNRPVLTRDGGGGGTLGGDYFFNAEYPMIRFLERNGYDVSYTTDVDATRSGSLLLNHSVFLSVGHDEYWSAAERTNVETARNAGVHLAFFSGNEVYWKIRWENSIDGTNTPYRTFVCYKEGSMGENSCGDGCDPSAEWTGLWRDGCSAGADACKPENALSGQASWASSEGTAIQVPSEYRNHRFWRNTSIASMNDGDVITLGPGTLGFEWDFEQLPGYYPSGRMTLSETSMGGKTHKLSLYRHTGGSLVFGAGTMQWAWGLDSVHDRGNDPANRDMQQATVNLFADMGVQPATLQTDLVAAAASTDLTAPVVVITAPSNSDTIPGSGTYIITGTASDANTVAGVEVSVDGGAIWRIAEGTTSWSFEWRPTTQGPTVIKARGYDDSGNMGAATAAPSASAINVVVAPPDCPCTLFAQTDVPASTNVTDGVPGVELGVKFRSNIDGYVTGIRFYKSTNDVGIHTGSLWSLDGDLLAQGTFTSESASGWQQLNFQTPVAIDADSVYVASYHSPAGYYSLSNPFFTTDFSNGPLTAIASVQPGEPNGIYAYSPTPSFPTLNFESSNYWVDPVFNNELTVSLPVNLLDFSASPGDNKVTLHWSTTQEINNRGFEVQRSGDGSRWEVLGFVNGSANGNSTTHYSYEDNNLPAGKYYYRLKQFDIDDRFTYSAIVSATLSGTRGYELGQSYPNPASDQAVIQFVMPKEETVKISLFDINGRLIKMLANETRHAGSHAIYLRTATLPAGVYYYKMEAGGFKDVKKLVVR